MTKSVNELVIEYFKKHPKQKLEHGPVVDWVTEQWLKEHGEPPRDPWRAIRKLYQEGFLKKYGKGIYEYDPDSEHDVKLWDFPPEIKEAIFKRDGFKCVWCGRGKKEGMEIVADHIKAKDLGGDNSVENGQTLCTQHNLQKKNYGQFEAGKRFFVRLYQKAFAARDKEMIAFCNAIFDEYDKFNIDIETPRP